MAGTPSTSSPTTSTANPQLARTRRRLILVTALIIGLVIVYEAVQVLRPAPKEPSVTSVAPKTKKPPVMADAGKILAQAPAITFTPEEVEAQSRQNYAAYTPKPAYAVTKTEIQYRSYDQDGTPITVYARVFQPVGKAAAPIFGFAPGTTGIGDECAPSLENPAKANWANYQSHMLTYAGQGYATVITDYEGMRDPDRIHHYMVGALEGRAVLDSVRALIKLNQNTDALDTSHVFVGGYSQGGHAAFWADQIAASYAPEIHLSGVVGFGPVMDVRQTLADILHAANINWFGPYVLESYADYYHDNYNLADILQPRYRDNLRGDVLAHCIDTDLAFWGHNPAAVYTPNFLSSLANNLQNEQYQQFNKRLEINTAGAAQTTSAKLINAGTHDNVVLPTQQEAAMKRICPNTKGPAELKLWPGASHYTTMVVSLADTLNWMHSLTDGTPVASTCP